MEMQQGSAMGKLIAEARKAKGLTQKDLAERLGVTDKAVSKWERGLSCPDISLLVPLAQQLELTTGELLVGEKHSDEQGTPAVAIMDKAVAYSNKSTAQRLERIRKGFLLAITVCLTIASLVCVLCDFLINASLGWSLIVVTSSIASWLLFFPMLNAKNNVVKKTLLVFTLVILPYLALLAHILSVPRVFTLGGCLAITALGFLWCCYLVFRRCGKRRFLAGGIGCLLMLPLWLCINAIVDLFVANERGTDFGSAITVLSISLVAVLLFVVDYYKGHLRVQHKP